MRLSNGDFEALQRAILELHEPADFDDVKRRLLVVMKRIIPNDYSIWHRYKFTPKPALVSYLESSARITSDWKLEAEHLLPLHPCAKYLAQTGDLGPLALRLSDFVSQRQLRDSFMWPFYKVIESNYNIAVPLDVGLGGVTILGLARRRKDFTERDRLILNLLRPHIVQSQAIVQRLGAKATAHLSAVSDQGLRDRFGLSVRESRSDTMGHEREEQSRDCAHSRA
jgi:hypothetical protein